MNTRRNFLLKLATAAGAPALLCSRASAQTTADAVKLEESDPVATALGFKLDTTKVDATKFPQHKNDQKCGECALYQAPGKPMGPCTTFQGKLVPEGGWCAAFAKRPAK